tara:strand:- start:2481 stop:3185 length:705 start_codon:yes stop_codon:yes gene_type:complete
MFKQLFGDGSSTDKDKGKKKKNAARDKARSGVANRYPANTDFSSARKKEARDKARSGMANKKPANTDFSASDMPTSKEMQAERTSGATPTMAAPGVRKAQQTKAKDLTTPTPAPANINPKGMTGTAKPPVADMMRREAATAPGMVAEGMAKSVGEAKSRGADKFIGKDGTQKAAVTKEELEASGLSLRDYLNQQQGKTRRPEMKSGGMAKAYKKGGKVRGAGKATKGVRACKMR